MKANKMKEERAVSVDSKKRPIGKANKIDILPFDKEKDDLLVIKQLGDEASDDLTSADKGSDAENGDAASDISEDEGDAPKEDEYEYDSSDEETLRNTVGNIPMEWYRDYEHVGYDVTGKKITKPKKGDELDEFLNKMENPDYWRTVNDPLTGAKVVLQDSDVDLIARLKQGHYVDPNYDPYQPWIDHFTHEKMLHPVTNHPAQKRSFIPSMWERRKVGQLVHAIKMGWLKPREKKETMEGEEEEEAPRYYQLWTDEDQNDITARYRDHIPAPKMALPGHEESYNPPPEYLFDKDEEAAWLGQDEEERRVSIMPRKYDCLRHVPAYNKLINERFSRCLDLYLCPRQRKMRMNVDADALLPKLPRPRDLHPFPTVQSIVYKGHKKLIRSLSIDPTGQWFATGSDDKTIKVWEVATGRCMKTLPVSGVVRDVAWNPSISLCLIAACVESDVVLINPQLGDRLVSSNTDHLIASHNASQSAESDASIKWTAASSKDYAKGFRLTISHSQAVTQISWHGQGDYLSAICPKAAESLMIVIHQVSKRRSQTPFKKPKGLVQAVLFHPTRPFIFVASQTFVRVYNLLTQQLIKKLVTNVKWVSSVAVHPGGDNIIIGSYDCKLGWFDLDLSTKPYKILRHHKKAIRQVCYHRHYPLFASASDDGTIIVCHGMVYNDLLRNALIVPVKVLKGHEVSKFGELGVMDCEFHPTQPWLISCGADGTARLFT